MTNHHVSGVFGSEAVVFVVRYERDDGEERADDEEEGRHDDEDDVAVGGDGAAAAVEGAEVWILADLGRKRAHFYFPDGTTCVLMYIPWTRASAR